MYKWVWALCFLWGASSSLAAPLSADLEMLSHPERVRGEIAEMISAYAPRIWWHSQDPYPPMDPQEFIRKSDLIRRNRFGRELQIEKAGHVTARMLRTLASEGSVTRPYQGGFLLNGEGFYLKFTDPSEGAAPLGSDARQQAFESGGVPIFWRLSKSPFAELLASDGKSRVLIEYWYHVPYNLATRIGIGNHQGDWESVAALVDLSELDEHLEHRLLAVYFSQHESGSWRCATELSRTKEGSHPEAFSAMGTHATYAEEGRHRSAVLTDLTEKGTSWDTWKNVKPLELEPYYGFPGAWGESRMFSFMTGPLVPGPQTKFLPRVGRKQALKDYAELRARCGF